MNSEELREMLVDLNRARDLEHRHRIVSDGVLEGLKIITQSKNTHEAFSQLLKVLKTLIVFDHAFVVCEKPDGKFRCEVATAPIFASTVWHPGKLFARVLAGQPVVMFDVSSSTEWQFQPEHIRELAVSVLHAPLSTPNSKAIFVCLSSQKAFFHKDHQVLLQRFAPLASQALYNLETSQKLTEEAQKLKKAQMVQNQLDRVKSEFISMAAHELRTPVASIMGYTELLSDEEMRKKFDEAQREDFLMEIVENSERLCKIIDDLLDVSRIEAGRSIPLDKQPVSIRTLLNKAIKPFQLKAGQVISLKVAPDLPATIPVDAHRVTQVIDNLLSNAIKYSPIGSNISVSAVLEERFCKVSVVDQGKGMDKHQISRIFDKFYRADSSDTAIRGLGLGMSIARQIVEDHGGTICVESQIGEGTRVHFSLPLA